MTTAIMELSKGVSPKKQSPYDPAILFLHVLGELSDHQDICTLRLITAVFTKASKQPTQCSFSDE